MSTSGSSFPPLPPLSPPTQVDKSSLQAQLQAQGRRAGLRATILSKLGNSPSVGKAVKLSGAE